jgi:hypothetical protein
MPQLVVMSESEEIVKQIYYYCKNSTTERANEYINDKMENLAIRKEFDMIDTILFSLDMSKLSQRIAKIVIEATSDVKEKIYMRNSFKENYQREFGV